ncbi:hypothetical protein QBC41DRAFT_344537 [Cercophora samala]|uniref:Uncharacterized protein n=1 Tax=Cercophora samala TaxID=330535 RepID=A0AA40DDX4_9PEZI|nr:hypothetical protein QBC41DRAFT_344537 [Cercophora samala]
MSTGTPATTTSTTTSWDLRAIEMPLDTSNTALMEFLRTATAQTATSPTTTSSQLPSPATGSNVCGLPGYFECGGEFPGCCPIGYACGNGDRCLYQTRGPIPRLEAVGRCPGVDGYGACHEEAGGGCCPGYYACFGSGCILTQKLSKAPVTFSYDTATATGEVKLYIYTVFTYPTSVDMIVDRHQTRDTTTSTGSFGGSDSLLPGVTGAAAIAIIVSSTIVGLMLLLALYFFIRRRRQKRRKQRELDTDEKGERDSPYSTLELNQKAHLHEADAERHKVELPSDQNAAWELEDTSYTPELWSSHGRAELELEPDVPIKDDMEVTVTPVSPSDTSETGQKPPSTPSPVSPLDTPETTKSSPEGTTSVSPAATAKTVSHPSEKPPPR